MKRYIRNSIFPLFYFFCFHPFLAKAQNMDFVHHSIDTLTSSYMAGRGYVNQGDLKAAEYIRNQFEKIGLQPFKESFFQYFKLKINTFPNRIYLKTGKTVLAPGQDYLVSPNSGPGKGSGKIYRIDSLLLKDPNRQSTFLSNPLKKGIVVYDHRDYQKILSLPNHFFDRIHEAKAIIELQTQKLTHSLSDVQNNRPLFELKNTLFDTLAKKAKFKVDALLIPEYVSQNVIGYIEGKYQPDSFLVITAHYDHLGMMGRNVYFPGANDNAAGISMLLELARYYSLPENKPDYSIVLMAFGGEEAGLIGSQYFVNNPLFPLGRILFLLNLDLVGTGEDGMMVVNGAVFKTEFELLKQINLQKQYLSSIQKRGLAANSDHYFFTEKGVKSFFFYTLGGIKAYHDIYDRPETLPLTKYKEIFSLIKDFFSTFSPSE